MRKLLFLQFSVFAVVVAMLGIAAFGLVLWDFQFPGTFKRYALIQGGMPLDLLLLVMFGLQHSIMARQGFKQLTRKLIPLSLERSFYVLFSGFVLFVLALLWCPMTPPLYDVSGTVWGYLLHGGALLGVLIIGIAGLSMDGLDLLGARAVMDILRDTLPQPAPFKTPWIYRIVRHPLYLGMLLLFWCTPAMTHDHLFFAEVMTAYLLIGIQFEERDLVRQFGAAYTAYQAKVPMLIPFTKRRR